MGIISKQKNTKPKRTDDATAAQKLAMRLRANYVYGIPIATLRATEFAQISPPDTPKQKLFTRDLDDLSKPEADKILHMSRLFHHATPKGTRGLFNMPEFVDALNTIEVWGYIRKRTATNPSHTGSFAVTNPPTRASGHAHIKGEEEYFDASAAIVVLDDRNGPEHFFSAIAVPGSPMQDFTHLGLGHHAFQYLVLEHAYAHVSGAADAQADMMAAAQYMKKFGTDDVPRAFADARAMDAVWKTAQHLSEKTKAKASLKERFNLVSFMRRRKAANALSSSNWSNVMALDAIIDGGITAAQQLTHKDIHDMRFQDVNHDKKKVITMVSILQEKAIHKGIKAPILRDLADVAAEIVLNAEVMPEMMDETPGMRDVMGLIRRFKKAADNLYNRTSNPQLKIKDKRPVPPSGPRPRA